MTIAPDMTGVQGKVQRAFQPAGEAGAKAMSDGISKSSAVIAGAIGGLVATATSKAISMVTSSIDSAIKRVDTLNNATRTFENMGISATDSKKAMTDLTKSIQGLPTPLDGAVRGMTALTATYGDVGRGQKVFSALNNAILGFGGSASMVDNAIMQLSQLPMDGPLDAQTWNSLRNSGLTPLLTAMAKDSGMSVAQMKEAFGKGELTVQDFTDRLVKMNTDGGGGLKSLEQIAKDSTKGIGTGFDNMKTAITRGMASIIENIGSKNISNAITAIGSAFETTLRGVSKFVGFIKSNSSTFIALAAAIVGATAATMAYSAITTATAAVTGVLNAIILLQTTGVGAARAAWLLLNTTMAANPIMLVVGAVGALVAILATSFFQTNNNKSATDKLKTARDQLTDATTKAKVAEDALKGAELGVEGATLNVERAQRYYNEALKQYGANSFEARDAAYQLKSAKQQLKDAENELRIKTQEATDANNDFKNKSESFKKANETVASGANSAAGAYSNFATQISKANEAARKSDFKGVSQAITATPFSRGFATGGFTGRGGVNQPAGIVHAGEYVIPQKFVNQSTGLPYGGGSGIEYNIGTINISSEVDGDRWIRRLTNNQEITSAGLVPQQSYMGAN